MFIIYIIGVILAIIMAIVITLTDLKRGAEFNFITDTIRILLATSLSWVAVILLFKEVENSEIVTINPRKHK